MDFLFSNSNFLYYCFALLILFSIKTFLLLFTANLFFNSFRFNFTSIWVWTNLIIKMSNLLYLILFFIPFNHFMPVKNVNFYSHNYLSELYYFYIFIIDY